MSAKTNTLIHAGFFRRGFLLRGISAQRDGGCAANRQHLTGQGSLTIKAGIRLESLRAALLSLSISSRFRIDWR